MSAPKLSVLLTVYNGQVYLAPAVESVLGQTFSDFEFLLIDDGSTDDSYAILESFARRDARIKLFRNETNLGITRSMNQLFRLAQGEYVTRHDADDLSRPERFAQQVAFLDATPQVGLVASQVQVIDVNGQPLDRVMFAGREDNESIQEQLLDHNCLCQGSVLFRRELLEVAGLYDETLEVSEDYDLWLRFAEKTRLAKLPEKLYFYRFYSTSVSRARYGRIVYDATKALVQTYHRRFGPHLTLEQRHRLGQAALNAAVTCSNERDWDLVYDSLSQVLEYAPDLFDGESASLPLSENPDSLKVAEKLFATQPQTPVWIKRKHHYLAQLRRRLGRWHMRQVFMGLSEACQEKVDAHLWPGLQHDPRWLMNRGVLVTLLRVSGRQLRRWVGGQTQGGIR